MNYEEKKQALKDYLLELAEKDVLVAFSGGVDSSLMLRLCCECAKEKGTKVYAVTMQTGLHPHGDVDIARRVAEEAGAEHLVIKLNELDEAGIRDNPLDRCYRCKRLLFAKLLGKAEQLGATYVVEGTNEDDLHVYRPGTRALKELGILSPLAKIGITKAEVRQMALEHGVSVARRASTPCMVTRFPYNTHLTYEALERADKAEDWLRQQGFYNVRVRIHGEVVRLEIDIKDMGALLLKREEIVEELKNLGYTYITLDMEGYRQGSMDIHVKPGYEGRL